MLLPRRQSDAFSYSPIHGYMLNRHQWWALACVPMPGAPSRRSLHDLSPCWGCSQQACREYLMCWQGYHERDGRRDQDSIPWRCRLAWVLRAILLHWPGLQSVAVRWQIQHQIVSLLFREQGLLLGLLLGNHHNNVCLEDLQHICLSNSCPWLASLHH